MLRLSELVPSLAQTATDIFYSCYAWPLGLSCDAFVRTYVSVCTTYNKCHAYYLYCCKVFIKQVNCRLHRLNATKFWACSESST